MDQYELVESIRAIMNAGHSISGAGVRGLLGVIDIQKAEIDRLSKEVERMRPLCPSIVPGVTSTSREP